MVLGRAAVAPGNLRIVQQGQVFALEQDPGRKAGKPLVEGGLLGKCPRSGEEGGEHGDRLAIEGEGQPLKPAQRRGA